MPASEGTVLVTGRDLTHADREAMRAARRDLQIVFQDPYASLDPRMTVGGIVAEPLRIHGTGDGNGHGRGDAIPLPFRAADGHQRPGSAAAAATHRE